MNNTSQCAGQAEFSERCLRVDALEEAELYSGCSHEQSFRKSSLETRKQAERWLSRPSACCASLRTRVWIPTPVHKLGMVEHSGNPSPGQAEAGESWGLAGQQV